MLNTVAEPPQPLQISGGIVECHATLVAINHYYLQHYLSQTRWYINWDVAEKQLQQIRSEGIVEHHNVQVHTLKEIIYN